MDDNANRSHFIDDNPESEVIGQIPLFAKSYDLNQIKYLWDSLEKAIAWIHPPARDGHEMKTALLEMRNLIPRTVFTHFVASMITRCDEFVHVIGDHIPY